MNVQPMHKFEKIDVTVAEDFIQNFAMMYINQRSHTNFQYEDLDNKIFSDVGFDVNELKKIMTQNAVARDNQRDQGGQPNILKDIYRSDLGELLMTYYFEENLPEGERFIIPLKNISFRERVDMPGRGLDAIGYKSDGSYINILLGEAKVSAENQSPPGVVDSTNNSLFFTQKKYKDNIPVFFL